MIFIGTVEDRHEQQLISELEGLLQPSTKENNRG